MSVLWGNIVSFIACTVMVLIGFIKKKDKIIAAQVLQFALMAVSNFLLGAFGGTVANIIGIVRNVILAKWKCTKGIKLSLIAAQAALSVTSITLNPITWIPLVANGMFTWYIDEKNIIRFKWVMIITLVMWAIYDLCHQNFVSVWFDAFTIASNGYSMWKIRKNEKEA